MFRVFPEIIRKKLSDLDVLINDALGMTEAEQLFLRKRAVVQEQIEKDREGHRSLRESCWSRSENETLEHEFLTLFHQSEVLTSLDYDAMKHNCKNFDNLNGLARAAGSKDTECSSSKTLLVIHVDECLFRLQLLAEKRDTKIRHCATDLQGFIKEVARRVCFYNDLRSFDQPHVRYYEDDDDGRSLEDYNFDRDSLAKYIDSGKESDERFYRERALRYRRAAARCKDVQALSKLIPLDLEKRFMRTVDDLDRLVERQNSHSIEALKHLRG